MIDPIESGHDGQLAILGGLTSGDEFFTRNKSAYQ
jgi:hypothetical protein